MPSKTSKKNSKKTYAKYTYNLGDSAKVTYIPNYVTNPDVLFEELQVDIPWDRYKYKVHGKEVTSPRLMHIINFTNDDNLENLPELSKIKNRVERITGVNFKYAVLNYYRDGSDYIGFHPDREVKNGDIVVSVTVGATRRFVLKHKFRENVKHVFILNHGDVLILNEAAIKTAYKHSVPKMANVGPRINITFRQG
ncbi:alpha-ketoglutarate-dependent dioxygenase AlkB [Tupanvirus soda lake]|uniref:Alpha-ketoglutarate-dependent dioxygenase AlkB n=2 Tax=Tupanvirus TaxID=2094720 RepID=A0A6N1NLV9_9VIRU|nr:alpha-ketoglutarate-dependent dioxygenase AlkB [Tupanvirus soda lake]QKU35455.1 alpha-ketoglutarate-dependent dioxygenase AlkB [Tupanvirus soda lake]